MNRHDVLQRLYGYFAKNLRQGRILSHDRLLAYAKANKLPLKKLKLLTYVRQIRRHFKCIALYGPIHKTPHYARYSFWRPGVYFCDMAFFRKDLEADNDDCSAFLLVVNALSHVLYAYPTPDKTSESWKQALTALALEKAEEISYIISDQDSAAKPELREYLYKQYQITWSFSKHRSKAYLAEVYIK